MVFGFMAWCVRRLCFYQQLFASDLAMCEHRFFNINGLIKWTNLAVSYINCFEVVSLYFARKEPSYMYYFIYCRHSFSLFTYCLHIWSVSTHCLPTIPRLNNEKALILFILAWAWSCFYFSKIEMGWNYSFLSISQYVVIGTWKFMALWIHISFLN